MCKTMCTPQEVMNSNAKYESDIMYVCGSTGNKLLYGCSVGVLVDVPACIRAIFTQQ